MSGFGRRQPNIAFQKMDEFVTAFAEHVFDKFHRVLPTLRVIPVPSQMQFPSHGARGLEYQREHLFTLLAAHLHMELGWYGSVTVTGREKG